MHINDLLRMTITKGASDLHLKAGEVPVLRINGELVPQDEMSEMTSENMKQVFEEVTTDEQRSSFADELELDFAYQVNVIGRFRVNAYLQGGTISLACRPVRTQIPTIEELGLPEVWQKPSPKAQWPNCGHRANRMWQIDYPCCDNKLSERERETQGRHHRRPYRVCASR